MLLRPGTRTVVAAGLAMALALAAAALAWSRPREGIGGRTPLGVSAAGALRIEDSRGEAAILDAPALAPGTAAVGSVTVRSRGDDGQLTLSRARLTEAPGVEGGLGMALWLRIRDLGDRGKIVYAGPLAAMPVVRLGRLPAGESRRYRFAAFLPEPGFVDNGLSGSQVSFDYRWRLRR